MCVYLNEDEMVTVLHRREQTARKVHRCQEGCDVPIEPGERYFAERYVNDGAASSHKTCARCWAYREWLLHECGGFLYGGVREDFAEHLDAAWWTPEPARG